MRKEILKIKNVNFGYSNNIFLSNCSFSILEREFVGIIGPNGGGKTTLLKLLIGLLKPVSGKIKLFGDSPTKSRFRVGYMSQFEDIDVDFPINIFDIVLQSRFKFGKLFYNKKDYLIVEKILHDLELWKFRSKMLNELSGGEKQRVFVARALVNEPELLILDEPVANFDIYIQEEFYRILKKLNKKIAIIIVDHDIDMISRFVKRVLCVNHCKHNSVKSHRVRSNNRKNLKELLYND